jgi:protein TonB
MAATPSRPASQPAPAAATPPPPPPPAPAPVEFNLGGTDAVSNAVVTGDHVIPASLDRRIHNQPPIYPEDAARRGQHGAVVLLIHVSAEGLTAGTDVLQSSGVGSLDQAAEDAVRRWRFLPAVRDGVPVAFDMPMRFVFEFN